MRGIFGIMRGIMLYYFKKGKNAAETQKKTCAVCGEGAVTGRTCLKRFVKVLARQTSWPHPAVALSSRAAPRASPLEVSSGESNVLIRRTVFGLFIMVC